MSSLQETYHRGVGRQDGREHGGRAGGGGHSPRRLTRMCGHAVASHDSVSQRRSWYPWHLYHAHHTNHDEDGTCDRPSLSTSLRGRPLPCVRESFRNKDFSMVQEGADWESRLPRLRYGRGFTGSMTAQHATLEQA